MSYLINQLLCPNYEDYDEYGCKGNAFVGFPDMWEPEIQAEAGVYEERQRLRQQIFFMARDSVQRTIMHFKNMKAKHSYIAKLVNKAMRQLAEEYGWKVKNYDCVKHDFVSPIIRTSLRIDEDDSMDVDFDVVFPPKQTVKPKPRKIVNNGSRQNFVQAVLVQLIEENGWKKAEPLGYRGTITKPYKIT